MRIVIDLQGAQTQSRFRGIGRFSLALSQALVRNRGDHEILIALSDLLSDNNRADSSSLRRVAAAGEHTRLVRSWPCKRTPARKHLAA